MSPHTITLQNERKIYEQTITAQGDGYRVATDYVGADGKATHQEDTSHLDGKAHAVTGNPEYDTEMGTKVDAYTIVGQKKAVAIAVRGNKDRRRWSKLRERLSAHK
jgi:hypothetical protein